MKHTDPRYQNYLAVLHEELVPAMGCTEPVAVAFAAAKAREVLGQEPSRVLVEASGNIIKNVKSVVVPNTGGLKGIKAAAAAGIVAGDAGKKLEAIASVSGEKQREIGAFLERVPIEVVMADTERVLEITITLYAPGPDGSQSSARIRIINTHTNIASVEKDGKSLFSAGAEEEQEAGAKTDRTMLDVEAIMDFAGTVHLDHVRELIERQVAYNTAISAEGLRGNYGANIGRVLRENYGDDVKIKAKAAAAAGSDARMSGCGMPVIILSGSGNQGMAASLPVIEYAAHLHKGKDELIRALVLADLIAIHLKTGIGRLSAYCGVVCAGAAAGAGIAYLKGGGLEDVSHTLVNALAITSGIVCDGAKPSCAAKIAASVDAGILGHEMFSRGQQFYGGDGIIAKGVENTIRNISRLGKEGMRKTDKEIIQIMLDE
ncbi:MAG: L-serine ammonia-lyase, iron-sulfur-dependent, subunit alpha [Spirochaetaceae bacterium]|jgi:L-cysteine desulfidase|nr:L-serine ammonia-lyase, iron-sulfur-dependent, subunit alpha [Spirochaetaceae bacterium]